MKTRTKLILATIAFVVIVSCANLVPRQGWKKSLGPVVPHDTFPADCSICHESGSWDRIKPDFQFDHLKETGYALEGAHARATCLMCHNDRGPVQQFSAKGCKGCHEDVHRGRQGISCEDCHNQDTWRPLEAISLHSRTRFPLVGAHAAAECSDCHAGAKNNNFEAVSVECDSCHRNDFTRSTTIDHAAMGFTEDCERCHLPTGWKPAAFDHPSTFPLTNGHSGVSCNACHTTPGVFTGLSISCVTCHQADFNATTDPAHPNAGFSTDCTQCHNTSQWRGAQYTHTAAFPLTNGHAGKRCSDCHSAGVYTGLSSDCASCHLDNFQATTRPNHTTAGFGTGCTQCHNTTRWQGASFTHPASFPLTNGHANRSCTVCHTTPGVYTGLSTTCVSCHQANYNNTTNPAHASAGFSTNCTQCHNTTTWLGANFTHPATFPLTNAHAGRSCTACHTTPGVYTGLSTTCVSCHQTSYNNTTNPAHAAAGFSTNCTQCHNTTTWLGATFTHTATFPLTLGHAGRTCNQCHTTPGVYTGLSTACASCHTADFQRVTNPNHVTGGFSTNCTQCHNTAQWQGASFQHTASFPLTSGHAGVSCTRCHTTPGVYTGLSTSCVSCHQTDYNQTTSPAHAAAGFPTTCTQCHNTTTWLGATFNHPATFPLTNAHANRSCNACHTTPGVYTGLSTTCVSCHQTNYNATTNPNHAAAGFGTNCTQCHNTTTWLGAVFNHPASFPLTNAHANRACNACHTTPNVYTGLQTACASCHQSNYNATTDPYHAAAGISTNCAQCHNTSNWLGATFNHNPAFPLTNAHANRACSACHTTPGTYQGLTGDCAQCHLPDYNATTNPRHAQSGYPTTCTQCHTTSAWTPSTFNHPRINRGNHSNLRCIDCHTVPSTTPVFSCTHCHTHNQQSMANVHQGRQGYQWLSTACYNCHD